MIYFFEKNNTLFAVSSQKEIDDKNLDKLLWLFGNADLRTQNEIIGNYVGPRKEMITPWSTNAVEITQNMGISDIDRIEEFFLQDSDHPDFDPMIQHFYDKLDQEIFNVHVEPEAVLEIDDISDYNQKEGLALNKEEIVYLENLSTKLDRKLTDSEIFGFSQVNSEHCRHKIFNGTFIIDGEEKPNSLFKMIKKTSAENHNSIISAYKDNVAFIDGPVIQQFSPKSFDKPDFYETKKVKSVLSLKAETHNFPTTVEPFNGAATGAGGEIRDRLAGGKGSLPLAGTAVYMTPYSRLTASNPDDQREWENMKERAWLYQTPIDLLIKASNGASDFGNKFGQPLIAGSLLTFEHEEEGRKLGYDKVIMQAGGIGYGKEVDSLKDRPKTDDAIVILGGDNYRIGMGGAAVSSADTGQFSNAIELNAVQRSNPEMQKRVANTIRAMVEGDINKIVSIHDHGAGGHLNCLSELVEETGGEIDLRALPIGDKTLSDKEIIGNESQERMGLVIHKEDLAYLHKVADRERSPIYDVGKVTDDFRFTFKSDEGKSPMDFKLEDMFGSSPHTVMNDRTANRKYEEISYNSEDIYKYVSQVLQLEAVACKDWLTNKVDRCVGGLVAKQQCCGPLQLPLNDVGVMALDYNGKRGIATSLGHSPISGLIDEVAGSRNAIAEALTNIMWAPLDKKLKSVSLSANWMWPCRNEGEDARLYNAVEAASNFAIELGINIPTGKDSLSMKQKYPNEEVISPGTVIISAAGECSDIRKVVEPVLKKTKENRIFYIDLTKDNFKLGGSSFAQIRNKIGSEAPTIQDSAYFKRVFNTIQELIRDDLIIAGHDISAGGLITTLLEMCFADNNLGAKINLNSVAEEDAVKLLFAENSGIIIQTSKAREVESILEFSRIDYHNIGYAHDGPELNIINLNLHFDIAKYRDVWYKTSYLLDQNQSGKVLAKERYDNYKNQPLKYNFPNHFTGKTPVLGSSNPRPKAAIIREKGSNSEREMANAMYLAGFDVKDVHMTDLISGRETLEEIQFIGTVGGFSNSDVLGSAKGWAGAFLYNEKARTALRNFFDREDTLSVGICNGCQLFLELEMINRDHDVKPKMHHNDSHKHESSFTSVKIQENNSVMLSSLAGTTLGVWISHGEGKFNFPYEEDRYNIIAKYGYENYPANPNGSDFNTAMMASDDGRHLITMPHIERSTFQWNWANYPEGRNDEVSPWLEAFVNAKKWLEKK